MDNFIDAGRLILITLLAIYEVYAFRKGKPLKNKLLPTIILIGIGLMFIVLVPFLGVTGGILAILLVELSLLFSMLVVIGEIVIILLGSRRDIKKVLQLIGIFILLIMLYYLGERVF